MHKHKAGWTTEPKITSTNRTKEITKTVNSRGDRAPRNSVTSNSLTKKTQIRQIQVGNKDPTHEGETVLRGR